MTRSERKKKMKAEALRLHARLYSAADALRNYLDFDMTNADSDDEIRLKDTVDTSALLSAIDDLETSIKRL